jgi:ribosomal protein S1
MRNIRSLWATPLAIAALSLGLPGTAAAEDCKVQTADGKTINGRIFEGMIKKVSKKNFTITKGGEMVKFVPYKDVAVKGEKTEYKKLKKDDWLRICFRRMDKPRYAYEITVIPAPDDKAEEL